LFGAEGVVFGADGVGDLVHEFAGLVLHVWPLGVKVVHRVASRV
jgi:hypothetical protein